MDPLHVFFDAPEVGNTLTVRSFVSGVEAAIGEGQGLGVELHVLQAAHQAAVGEAVAAGAEHGGVDVADHHLAPVAHARL